MQTQMVNEGNKTLEHGLKNIDTYYSAKGSYMWVVCIGEDKPAKESKDADTDKEGDEGADEAEEKTPDPIVACVVSATPACMRDECDPCMHACRPCTPSA